MSKHGSFDLSDINLFDDAFLTVSELKNVDKVVEMLKSDDAVLEKIPKSKRYYYFEEAIKRYPELLCDYRGSSDLFKKIARKFAEKNPDKMRNAIYAKWQLLDYDIFRDAFLYTEEGRKEVIRTGLELRDVLDENTRWMESILNEATSLEILNKFQKGEGLAVFLMYGDQKELIKVLKVFPNIFSKSTQVSYLNEKTIDNLIKLYDGTIENESLCNKIKNEVLNVIKNAVQDPSFFRIKEEYVERLNNINKIVFSKIITSRGISIEEIVDYIEKPDKLKFRNLVEKAYGIDAKDILDRLDCDIDDIYTLSVFDTDMYSRVASSLNVNSKVIMEMYTVYEMESFCNFLEICDNENMRMQLNDFLEKFMMQDHYYRKDIASFDLAVNNFYMLKDILKNRKFSELTDEQIEILKVYYNDINRKVISSSFTIDSVEELDRYLDTRSSLIEPLKDNTSVYEATDIIYRQYFSMVAQRKYYGFNSDEFDAYSFIKRLNIKDIIADYEKKAEDNLNVLELPGGLTKEEYETIKLIQNISDCHDIGQLNECYQKMKESKFYCDVGPIFEKIKNYYCEQFASTLTVLPSLEHLPKGEEIHVKEGLSVTMEDGVVVYNFEGAELDAVIHVAGLNLQYDNKRNNLEELYDSWNSIVGGSTSISCIIFSKELIKYAYTWLTTEHHSDKIAMGFLPKKEQIIGYGTTDLGTSSRNMEPKVLASSDFKKYYDVVRSGAERIKRANGEYYCGNDYAYLEAAISRFSTSLDDRMSTRTQPDFIFSFNSDGISDNEKEIAKAFGVPILRFNFSYYLEDDKQFNGVPKK